MTNLDAKRKWVFLFGVMLITASVISGGVFSAKRQQPKKEQERRRVTSMPQVFSKVKKLEVVRAWIEDAGTPAVRAAVEIRNNSDKAVMAVDLMCGEGGVTRNGLTDEENPIVVIKPHDTAIVEMNFGAMTFGAPLVVSAVTYADGTEEGDEFSLKLMRKAREHDRQQLKLKKQRLQKGEPPQ